MVKTANRRKIRLSVGAETVELLVNPQDIKINEPMITKKKDLLSGGYLFVGKPGLKSLTLETFLPSGGEFGDSSGQLATLEEWRKAGKQITVAISGVETIKAKITDMSTTIKENDPDTWIGVTLTESSSLQAVTRRYTVKRGDTLQKIAKKYYKKASKWLTIYNANSAVIGKNPKKLTVGTKLTIPW